MHHRVFLVAEAEAVVVLLPPRHRPVGRIQGERARRERRALADVGHRHAARDRLTSTPTDLRIGVPAPATNFNSYNNAT
jgi:hypothetical protein